MFLLSTKKWMEERLLNAIIYWEKRFKAHFVLKKNILEDSDQRSSNQDEVACKNSQSKI